MSHAHMRGSLARVATGAAIAALAAVVTTTFFAGAASGAPTAVLMTDVCVNARTGHLSFPIGDAAPTVDPVVCPRSQIAKAVDDPRAVLRTCVLDYNGLIRELLTPGAQCLSAPSIFKETPLAVPSRSQDLYFCASSSFAGVLLYKGTSAVSCTAREFPVVVKRANTPPVADGQSLSLDEDTTAVVTLTGSDPDGDAIGFKITDLPDYGRLFRGNSTSAADEITSVPTTIASSAAGAPVTYKPDANFAGSDSFQFKTRDGFDDSAAATASITVNGVNDAPAAVDDSYSTDEDAFLYVAAPGVLGNDTDVDGNSLFSLAVIGPAHGALLPLLNGSFLYVPQAGFHGSDSFGYRAFDGAVFSGIATVTITVDPVNDAPVAAGDSYSTDEDTALNVPAPGVLGNDSDADGDALTAALVSDVAHGSLTLNADGSFAYTPDANFAGSDSFTYRANDGTAGSNVVTVTISVDALDDAPTAVNDSATVGEDSGASAIDVLANDTDVDGGPKTIALASDPANGMVVITGGGTGLTYQPDANYCNSQAGGSPDTFTYELNGGDTATVSVTVTCVDDAPVAVNDAATVDQDAAASAIDVLANDTDVDAGPKSVASVTQPANGAVVISGGGTGLTYQPDPELLQRPAGHNTGHVHLHAQRRLDRDRLGHGHLRRRTAHGGGRQRDRVRGRGAERDRRARERHRLGRRAEGDRLGVRPGQRHGGADRRFSRAHTG